MQKSKGFTIIELVVVIAIIAVLAAIVLVNVTQYIAKGRDAALKGNMDSLMKAGAVYFDNNSDYDGFCAATFATGIALFDQTPGDATAKICNESAGDDAWAACAQEIVTSTDYWCVDSTGTKKKVTGTCSAATFLVSVCP